MASVVLLAGGTGGAKLARGMLDVAAELVSKIEGLRPVDAGRLEQARIVESLTALMIGMNARYKTHAGVRVTGLPAELWPQQS